MNNKIKIIVGMLAGIVAGAMFAGTAFAAPRTMAIPAYNGCTVTGSYDAPANTDAPTIADMYAFMGQHRGANGEVDLERMHADLANGQASASCGGDATDVSPTSYKMMSPVYY